MTRNSDTDEREESDTQLVTSRRAVLGALASAGVLGATASGAPTGANSNLSIGGGAMADKVDEFAIRTYQGPLSERPSAGVKDRVWVVEGGAEDGAVYHDDGSSWSKVSRQFESVHTENGAIGTGHIDTDHSVIGDLPHEYQGAAVDAEGKHFAFRYDANTSEVVLESTLDPRGGEFTELYRWSWATKVEKREIHVTQSGTLLAGPTDKMYRSTDGGQSWTQVATIGSTTWSITENASGTLIANASNPSPALFKSTDDGASWTQIADGTTFPNFEKHVHRVRWIPNSDYLVVTGGDGAPTSDDGRGYYRSTDGGTTWDYYSPLGSVQWVGIGVHPDDGNTYFLAADSGVGGGPIIKVSDDGATVSYEIVTQLTLNSESVEASGSFEIATLHNPTGRSCYLASSINHEHNVTMVSDDLHGTNWRVIGDTDVTVFGATKSPGAYETIIDTTEIGTIISGDRFVRTEQAKRYGDRSSASLPIDKRQSYDSITFRNNHYLDWREITEDNQKVFWIDPPGYDSVMGYYQFGKLHIRNGTQSQNILTIDIQNQRIDSKGPLRIFNAGDGFGTINAENLAGETGNFEGELRRDDGTNTSGTLSYCEWTGSAWRKADGTTFT